MVDNVLYTPSFRTFFNISAFDTSVIILLASLYLKTPDEGIASRNHGRAQSQTRQNVAEVLPELERNFQKRKSGS
jgi:hypothetical protein